MSNERMKIFDERSHNDIVLQTKLVRRFIMYAALTYNGEKSRIRYKERHIIIEIARSSSIQCNRCPLQLTALSSRLFMNLCYGNNSRSDFPARNFINFICNSQSATNIKLFLSYLVEFSFNRFLLRAFIAISFRSALACLLACFTCIMHIANYAPVCY